MKRQQGFTLIELVAVIVLLGILAATALPRFVNLQSDAREAVLNGIAGSMQGASAQTYAKALIHGAESTNPGTVDIGNGVTVQTAFGYPQAAGGANSDIENLLQLDSNDVKWNTPADADTDTVRYVGYDRDGSGAVDATDACVVSYTQSTAAGQLPQIAVDKSNC
jgi:MSHA pilin protein MshA